MSEAMNGDWWAGSSEEWYQVGPCTSREEAIEEGRAYFDDGEGFHICEAKQHQLKFDARTLIDSQYFENEDYFTYDDGSDPDRLEGSDQADLELQRLLDDWLDRHRKTFVQPTIFAWTKNKEFIEASEDA